MFEPSPSIAESVLVESSGNPEAVRPPPPSAPAFTCEAWRAAVRAARDQEERDALVERYAEHLDEDTRVELPDEAYELADELMLLAVVLDPSAQAAAQAALARQHSLGFPPFEDAAFLRGYFKRRGHQNPPQHLRVGYGPKPLRAEDHGYNVAAAEAESDPRERAATEWYGVATAADQDGRGRPEFLRGWDLAMEGRPEPHPRNRASRARMYGHRAAMAHVRLLAEIARTAPGPVQLELDLRAGPALLPPEGPPRARSTMTGSPPPHGQ